VIGSIVSQRASADAVDVDLVMGVVAKRFGSWERRVPEGSDGSRLTRSWSWQIGATGLSAMLTPSRYFWPGPGAAIPRQRVRPSHGPIVPCPAAAARSALAVPCLILASSAKKQAPCFGHGCFEARLPDVNVRHAQFVALLTQLPTAVPDPAGSFAQCAS
jgi:hypothetical protein